MYLARVYVTLRSKPLFSDYNAASVFEMLPLAH